MWSPAAVASLLQGLTCCASLEMIVQENPSRAAASEILRLTYVAPTTMARSRLNFLLSLNVSRSS